MDSIHQFYTSISIKPTKYCKICCAPKFIDVISSAIGFWTLARLEEMLGCICHRFGTLVSANSSILHTNLACEISGPKNRATITIYHRRCIKGNSKNQNHVQFAQESWPMMPTLRNQCSLR